MKSAFIFSILFFATLFPVASYAETGCTLIVSYPEGAVIREDGDCTQRRSPASTFKVPLTLMGFDSGILKDAHNPSIPYKDEYHSDLEFQKKTTDPLIWLKDSIVWFSQQLTLKLGAEKFEAYTKKFKYGNEDVTGAPFKNDGLTQSWLFSSLLISPREQATFLAKLLDHDLGVSEKAYTNTIALMPEFKAEGWRVFGKTGSGWLRDAQGASDKSKPQGWFVGWAEKDGKKIIFAKLILEDQASDTYGGPKARDLFLKELADTP